MTLRRSISLFGMGACLLLGACNNSQPVSGGVAQVQALACELGHLSEADILGVTRMPADAPLADLSHYQARNAPLDPGSNLNRGACASNTRFRFAAGLGDITGATAGSSMSGYVDGEQITVGMIDRQHARAFVIESECESRLSRVVLVQMDIGLAFHSIRQGVLDAIAADPELSTAFGPGNVLLNASHSHSTVAGQSHHDAYHILTGGHDAQNLAAAVDGTVAAIRRAWTHLQGTGAGTIRFAQAELLNGTTQRSPPAYAQNPESERQAFLDSRGEEVRTNRMMSLLRLQRDDGTPVGQLNWYAIHGTSISKVNERVSGDNKGYAAWRFEQAFGTRYADAFDGQEVFLAGFMQADEGDASPNPFIMDLSEAELRDPASPAFVARGGGRDEPENALISGYKQYRHALDLYQQPGELITGEVRSATVLIQMPGAEAGLSRNYPEELAPEGGIGVATCMPALGVSFAGGAEDGRGPSAEGQTCGNTSQGDLSSAAQLLQDGFEDGMNGAIPPGLIVPAGCDNPAYDALGYACHAEKPIIFPIGNASPFGNGQTLEPLVQPLQIVVLGNLAIIALPWEVTTMSGRRLRTAVLDALQGSGVDYAVISGLSNGFIHYMTTREEYANQQYEGASTVYGPWTQEVVQSELVRLAGNLRAGMSPDSPYAVAEYRSEASSLTNAGEADDGTPPVAFGSVAQQPDPEYQLQADSLLISARFVAGHPRNDLRQEASFVYVEQQIDGSWRTIQDDSDWFLRYTYEPDQNDGANHLIVEWTVPADTRTGIYRFRHVAASNAGPYEGVTEPFELLPCAD